jgi:hypothetical protein
VNGVRLPLYSAIVARWASLFGSSPDSIRSFSLLCYLGCPLALYLAAASAYGKRTGIFAAVMAGASPFLQWLGGEASVYSLLILLSAMNLYCFVMLFKSDGCSPLAWAGYGFTALLGIWTHPVFVWGILFQLAAWSFPVRVDTPVRRKRIVFVLGVGAGIIALCMTPGLLRAAALGGWLTPLARESRAQRFSNAFVPFLFGFQGSAASTLIAAALPLSVLAVLCWLSAPSKLSKLTLCLVAMGFGPPVVLGLVAIVFGPLPLSRCSAIAVPALYALIARGIENLPRPYLLLSRAGLITAMLCALARQTLDPHLSARHDYRVVSKYLSDHVGSNDVVLVTSPFVVLPLEYCSGSRVPMNTIPAWDRNDAASVPAFDHAALRDQVATLSHGKDKCWLVLGCDQGDERAIENFFKGNLRRLEYREFSADLRLAAFRADHPVQAETRVDSPKSALNPLYGAQLYVSPDSPAKRQAREWKETRPREAALMDKIGAQPMALWLVRNNRAIVLDVKRIMAAAQRESTLPCFVTYYFPERDRGGFSAGGAQDANEYLAWTQAIADTIGDRKAVVILEPDALGLTLNLPERQRERRLMMLRKAVHIFSQKRGIISYIDAGHCQWVSPGEMANLLQRVGITSARGFALNVSNFYPNTEVITYGSTISKLLNGKPFVIDTSRNGLGATDQVINPHKH